MKSRNTYSRSFLVIPTICCLLQIEPSIAQTNQPTRLNDALLVNRDVSDFGLAPNDAHVVYLANQNTESVVELFSVPSDASADAIQLSPQTLRTSVSASEPAGSVGEFKFSPDGSSIVFSQDNSQGTPILVSALVASGSSVPLNFTETVLPEISVVSFEISPDGNHVVFLGRNEGSGDTNRQIALYRAPISGGSAVVLNGALPNAGDVSDFVISADSSTVVYRADQNTDQLFQLFAVPIVGGQVTSLTPTLASGRSTGQDFQINSLNTHVVYRADSNTAGQMEIFSVSVGGGASFRLNDNLFGSDQVADDFKLSADGTRAVYRAGDVAEKEFELFSAVVNDSMNISNTRLHPVLASGRTVFEGFQISPNSSFVAYVADQNASNVFELFSVNINGSGNRRLNRNLPNLADVSESIRFTPDSQSIIYLAEQNNDGVEELLSVPTAGGTVLTLNRPLSPTLGADVGDDFQISNDNLRVTYRLDPTVNNQIELFTSPIGRQGISQRLNRDLPTSSTDDDVNSFQVSANGEFVVYLAEQDTTNQTEVFVVAFPDIPEIPEELCLPIRTQNDSTAVICL